MIITVTLNPAIDKTVQLDGLKQNEVNRVLDIKKTIGGKGINVSKFLKLNGIDSLCTGFLGNDNKGEFIEFLKGRGVPYNFILVDGEVRTNTKIVDSATNTCTELNEAGPYISSDKLHEFTTKFSEMINKGDLVVFAGSVPAGMQEIYELLIKIVYERGASALLDAEGKCLELGMRALPAILKVNIKEFAAYTGVHGNCREEVWDAAYRLLQNGVERIMVTLGEDGVLYFSREGAYYCNSPKINPVCTVGGGDAVTAALVYCIENNLDSFDTVKYCAASGAAAVSTEVGEIYSLEHVKELLEQTKAIKFA